MLNHEKQIHDYEKVLQELKTQGVESGILGDDEIIKLEIKLENLKSKVYSELSPWERVEISRHPKRPKATDVIKNICDSFTEVFGDRLYGDDHAIITGFAMINGTKFVIIAQEKGMDTESRLYRNFGMPHPEGYRKALRMMKLAEKFDLPILSLLDTPGAYCGLEAEERGQGSAIAQNLFEMSMLKARMIVLLIGEGCSGGALGIGIGDRIGMLEHAYYSVISPEGCASILWRDAAKKEEATVSLKMQSEDLLEAGIVDTVIKEPVGGAHHNPKAIYQDIKEFVLATASSLMKIPLQEILDERYEKFRVMGSFQEA